MTRKRRLNSMASVLRKLLTLRMCLLHTASKMEDLADEILNSQNRDLLELMYGSRTPGPMSPSERNPLEIWVRSFDPIVANPERVLLLSWQFGVLVEPIMDSLAFDFYKALRVAIYFQQNPRERPPFLPEPAKMVNILYADFDKVIRKLESEKDVPEDLRERLDAGEDLYPDRMGLYMHWAPDEAFI